MATVFEKGQITIPAELREEMGLRAGTPVVFERRPEGALLRRGTQGVHPVDRVFGRLRLGRGCRREARSAPRTRDKRVVADFLVGAHAQLQTDGLLARDRGFFRTYFKSLRLIQP